MEANAHETIRRTIHDALVFLGPNGENWIQDCLAKDDQGRFVIGDREFIRSQAAKCCLIGALVKVTTSDEDLENTCAFLREVLFRGRSRFSLGAFNDTAEWSQVKELLEHAREAVTTPRE